MYSRHVYIISTIVMIIIKKFKQSKKFDILFRSFTEIDLTEFSESVHNRTIMKEHKVTA